MPPTPSRSDTARWGKPNTRSRQLLPGTCRRRNQGKQSSRQSKIYLGHTSVENIILLWRNSVQRGKRCNPTPPRFVGTVPRHREHRPLCRPRQHISPKDTPLGQRRPPRRQSRVPSTECTNPRRCRFETCPRDKPRKRSRRMPPGSFQRRKRRTPWLRSSQRKSPTRTRSKRLD